MTETKAYTKLTANIAVDDMHFLEKLVEMKKFASLTDAARAAVRDFRAKMEAGAT